MIEKDKLKSVLKSGFTQALVLTAFVLSLALFLSQWVASKLLVPIMVVFSIVAITFLAFYDSRRKNKKKII